jgi:hypothetical protein
MIPDKVEPIATYEVPQQVADVAVLVSVDVGALTPVFSTAVPPRGLSGLMRRRAYRRLLVRAGRALGSHRSRG